MNRPEGTFNWIHLSDWHEGKPAPLLSYDRQKLLKELKRDIERRRSIDPRLETIDAIIISGDIAWSGQNTQFAEAKRTLLDPIRSIVGLNSIIVLAPGNHDLDRKSVLNGEITEDIQLEWCRILENGSPDGYKKIGGLLRDPESKSFIISPFENFYSFSSSQGFPYDHRSTVNAAYISKQGHERAVGIVAVNTALCCARNMLTGGRASGQPQHWDYGVLAITEQQVDEAIEKTEDCDVRILVMHHPINWLSEAERSKIEGRIVSHFDLIIHGHEHLPRFITHSGNSGEVFFVPAGSAYDGRLSAEPIYTNAFNYGLIDLTERVGSIHHRRWAEEKGQWEKDLRFWSMGRSPFVLHKRERYAPENREYLHKIERLYQPAFGKRPFRRMEINLKQTPVDIDGTEFIVCHCHQVFELHDGTEEEYTIKLSPNQRILSSALAQAKSRALYDIRLPDLFRPSEYAGEVDFYTRAVIPNGSFTIDYEYKRLEYTDGVWYFSVNRFADQLSLYVETAKGYRYETAEVGGAPPLQRTTHGFRTGDSFRAPEGHVPYQGYLIQWYRAE